MLDSLSADRHIDRQGHTIICRTVSIPENELLKRLGIHNAQSAAYQAYRHLHKAHPDLTPQDIGRAVREVRLMAELWIDAVAARLHELQPRGPKRRRRAKPKLRVVVINSQEAIR